MGGVDVLGRIGPDGPGLLLLYTGGTIGMGPGPDGALVPLDLRDLGAHLPFIHRLPLGLTVATFADPIDSAAMGTSDWVAIADAIVRHAPGHRGWSYCTALTPWPTRRREAGMAGSTRGSAHSFRRRLVGLDAR